MRNEIYEAMKEIEKMLNDADLDYAEEGRYCLEWLGLVIRDAIKWGKVSHYLITNSKRLPFDMIMDLNDISEWHELNEVEREWGVPGFNDWYKEAFGITVDEATRQQQEVSK